MKLKDLKNSVKNGVVNGVCSTLGGVHFVADSIANGAMSLEATIKKKAYGQDPEDVKRERVFKTLQKQVAIQDTFSNIIKRKEKAKAQVQLIKIETAK